LFQRGGTANAENASLRLVMRSTIGISANPDAHSLHDREAGPGRRKSGPGDALTVAEIGARLVVRQAYSQRLQLGDQPVFSGTGKRRCDCTTA